MAVMSAVLKLGDDPVIKIAALAITTSSAEQSLGRDKLFAINATKDITVKKGLTGMGAAAATDYRIPANTIVTLDMGEYTHLRVFNLDGAATADIYIVGLAR